jgi:fluoroacetyl-CoA thioesterase
MLSVGLTREATRTVTDEDSAARVSALVPAVYASARMIGFIEATCAELMADHLEPGQTSVGTGFDLKHESATPIGMKVRVRVQLVEIERRKCVFEIEAHDEVDRISVGRHERFVVDRSKFESHLIQKAQKLPK